jgi:hypothetical protein
MTDSMLIPRFKKERHLRSLSEDDFRDTVVRPLFLRLGYRDGRDLCGPLEAGKDAIFTETNRLGIVEVVALQTKKGNLNLASRATDNIVTAETQLRTALSTDVILSGGRQKLRPTRAILCASGKINESARVHIQQNISSPNVTFLDIDDLIPLIDQHLPEAWMGIKVQLLPYFEAIKTLVEGTEFDAGPALPPSGSNIFGVAASDARFVTLSLFHNVIKIKTRRGGIVDQHTEIEEFPLTAITTKPPRRIAIVGDAGSGKSTALLRIAYLMALKGLTEGGANSIPVLLRGLDIYNSSVTNLAEYSERISKGMAGTSDACFSPSDMLAGRLVILIDSLDELPSDAARTTIIDLVDNLLVAYPKVQVILTTRPSAFLTRIVKASGYSEYRINSISWRQAQKILTAVRKGRRMPASQSNELLRRLEKIHGIELNPLLVTVFAATTDFTKQDLPANITELFKKFTELMLGRWDEEKGLRLQYQANVKDFVLTRIAFHMHFAKLTSISRTDAERLARRELVSRGYAADAALLLSEIFDRSGLFRVVDENIEFRHLLLQEFFAGRGIDSIEQVKMLVSDEWWKRALVFYFGDHPTQIEHLDEIAQAAASSPAADLHTAATTIGLALQACYLSPVSAKIAVWKWVVDALCISRDHVTQKHGGYPLLGFLHYYMGARDSTALGHLRGAFAELDEWCSETKELAASDSDSRRFWLIVGLIESGDLAEAEQLLKKFRPTDPKLLLAIHLGCYFTALIRPASREDRDVAKRMGKGLESHVDILRAQVAKEFQGTLIEMREGKLLSVEHEADDP